MKIYAIVDCWADDPYEAHGSDYLAFYKEKEDAKEHLRVLYDIQKAQNDNKKLWDTIEWDTGDREAFSIDCWHNPDLGHWVCIEEIELKYEFNPATVKGL